MIATIRVKYILVKEDANDIDWPNLTSLCVPALKQVPRDMDTVQLNEKSLPPRVDGLFADKRLA